MYFYLKREISLITLYLLLEVILTFVLICALWLSSEIIAVK